MPHDAAKINQSYVIWLGIDHQRDSPFELDQHGPRTFAPVFVGLVYLSIRFFWGQSYWPLTPWRRYYLCPLVSSDPSQYVAQSHPEALKALNPRDKPNALVVCIGDVALNTLNTIDIHVKGHLCKMTGPENRQSQCQNIICIPWLCWNRQVIWPEQSDTS